MASQGLSIAEIEVGPSPLEEPVEEQEQESLGSIPVAAGTDDVARADYLERWGIGFTD